MTEEQKESLKFYTTNDYLLINGILWGEEEKEINEVIRIINEDGRGVMKEALEVGVDVRWNCSKEEGERLYKLYQKRFPIIDSKKTKEQIICRAKQDISNMRACLKPLTSELVLYRNIKTRFIESLTDGETLHYLGFSSCSLCPHIADNAVYGSSSCTLFEITVPAGTPAIRLDQMPDIRNEPDEVILPPMDFQITRIDKERNKIYMIGINA